MDDATQQRQRMVDLQPITRDIVDEPVLAAMRAVPRHRFVPPAHERLDLQVLARDVSDRLRTASMLPVQFVPMTGEVATKRDP